MGRILTGTEAIEMAAHAGRGNLRMLGDLLRAFVAGEVRSKLMVEAGRGVLDGVGTIYKTGVSRLGGIIKSSILVDLTGLASIATDLDIIGVGTAVSHLGQFVGSRNGNTPFAGLMTCLEVPVGGAIDIDLYYATEATGKLDDAVTGLTETALITAGGNWTLALTKAFADPVALLDKYLYLTSGAATAGTYTAGKFLIDIFAYDA